ncbi:pantoate--beta-alanine ligase [Sphingomonas sp.]|uniref:pantoate--beta-alanine ligase n=1 Tax=Sphingomonas sp. TaxID=28214 RepID=UPI0025F92A3A|nr:pantoate--beta-alanine ligase [Sphingomonas sp.]
MQIIRRLSDLSPALSPWRAAGEKLALVPTMGALHAGHLALVEAARAKADRVIASIFVNPLQFNDPNDLARYPRQEVADAAKLEQAGCNLLWLPTAEQLYPAGFATTVSVAGVSDRWEGEHRPGHFDGVATVVSKLFIAALPDIAVFGEKDWQQLAVIRRMTADLDLPIEIFGHPTIREADGLAMSSRNALLSAEDRGKAPALHRLMNELAAAIAGGGEPAAETERMTGRLEAAGFGPVDYVAYVDGDSLEPLERFQENGRLLAAVFLGTVRLIDNISVISDTV